MYDNLSSSNEGEKKITIFKILKYLGLSTVVFLLLIFIVVVFNISNIINIYKEVKSGKNNVEQSIYFFKAKDFKTANDYAKLSVKNFSDAKRDISRYDNFILNNLFYFGVQKDNFSYLISSADALSEAMVVGTEIGVDLQGALNNDQSFLKLTTEEKKRVLKIISDSYIDFKTIQQKIDFADTELKKINMTGLFKIGGSKIIEFKDKINELNIVSQKVIPFMEVLPKALGYPEKSNFLVILQNSDELRPTGGFIGTYGILQIENSDFLRMDTHDVYHMDMPVKDIFKIEPPGPMKKYLGVDNWFLRDANWSPDWPTAAKKIEYFFKEENRLLTGKDDINNFKEDFDGILAVTPEVITDILRLIGPIVIDGQEYNQDNFVDLLQYRVEKGYVQLGVPSWQRKEVIGEITSEIKKRIFDMSLTDLYGVFQVVGTNVDKKNVMVYFHDENLESIALRQGWGGNLINQSNDFLMVVDANMASLKTDAVINRKLEYKIDQGVNGVFADLKIKYSHNGSFDWKTTRYRSFVRIYVPDGSELIQTDGFDGEKVWTYPDLGKTVFSSFISIEPGDVRELFLRYKLPAKVVEQVSKDGKYDLYLQKQPGSRYDSFSVQLNFGKNIKEYNPTGLFVKKENGNKVIWSDIFETDKEFSVLIK